MNRNKHSSVKAQESSDAEPNISFDAYLRAVAFAEGIEPEPKLDVDETGGEDLSGLDAAGEDAAPAKAEPKAVAPAVVKPTAKADDWGKPLEFDDIDQVAYFDSIRTRPRRVTKARIAKEKKQKRTAANTARKKRLRAAVTAKQPPKLPKPARFPVEDVTPEMKERFYEYVSRGDTPLARSLRGKIRVSNLIILLETYLTGVATLGRDPTLTEFRKEMRWGSKTKAQRAVTVLSKVFTEGGFGTDAELAKWSAEHVEAEAAEWAFAHRETERIGPP
jgi:hypothetical protein